MNDHKLYLNDILAAIESIETFVEGMDLQRLQKDDKTVVAVVRKLEINREAVKGIPKEVRRSHPEIP